MFCLDSMILNSLLITLQHWWLEEISTGCFLAAHISNLFLLIALIFPGLRAVGGHGHTILYHVSPYRGSSESESYKYSGICSTPRWLTASSLHTGLIVNHIIHILLNPNGMHSPLKFSFAEFPKCSQLLQCHQPQGEIRV